MKVVPLTEMEGEEGSVCVVRGRAIQEMGLDMVSVRCPETSRGRDQEAAGYDSGSQQRSALEAQIGELSSYSLHSVSS